MGNSAQYGNRGRRIALVVALLLLLAAAGTVGVVALARHNRAGTSTSSTNPGSAALAANASGVVNFSDKQGSSGNNNVIVITVNNLASPPPGFHYSAWLVNTRSKQALALGKLVVHGQSFTLNYYAGSTNLLGAGNELEITLEQGLVAAPTGTILLSATFPSSAFVYIKHLLFSFDATPGKVGLLVGFIDQVRRLNAVAQSLSTGQNTAAIQCAAQSVIDISEGQHGSDYKPLPAQCVSQHITDTGDGFGLLGTRGYIAQAETQTTLAAAQSDATASIRVHERHVNIALENVRDWLETVEQDALNLLNNPGSTARVQEIVTLAGYALHGVDRDGDGNIDYVKGEAGAQIAYTHGQYMTALVLAPTT